MNKYVNLHRKAIIEWCQYFLDNLVAHIHFYSRYVSHYVLMAWDRLQYTFPFYAYQIRDTISPTYHTVAGLTHLVRDETWHTARRIRDIILRPDQNYLLKVMRVRVEIWWYACRMISNMTPHPVAYLANEVLIFAGYVRNDTRYYADLIRDIILDPDLDYQSKIMRVRRAIRNYAIDICDMIRRSRPVRQFVNIVFYHHRWGLMSLQDYFFEQYDECTTFSNRHLNIYLFKNGLNPDELIDYTIPDGFKNIDSRAFNDCTQLRSIGLPDSITEIGEHAFDTCHALSSVQFPPNLHSIGLGAFFRCPITSLNLPDGLKHIGSISFQDCRISHLHIPEGLISIGDFAFLGNPLTHINHIPLPDYNERFEIELKHISTNHQYNWDKIILKWRGSNTTTIPSRRKYIEEHYTPQLKLVGLNTYHLSASHAYLIYRLMIDKNYFNKKEIKSLPFTFLFNKDLSKLIRTKGVATKLISIQDTTFAPRHPLYEFLTIGDYFELSRSSRRISLAFAKPENLANANPMESMKPSGPNTK